MLSVFILAACGAQTPERILEREIVDTRPVIETEQDTQDTEDQTLQSKGDGSDNKVQVKIAILLPLTGDVGETGKALLNAATMALFDAYDPRLQLLPYDTKASIEETEIATHKALNDGADIIIGPLLSENVKAAGSIAGSANIPLLGFSNDYTAASPNSFILGFLPENEVRRVVNYAVANGYEKFAGLFPEGRYGDQVRMAYGLAVNNNDAEVSTIETYQNDADQVFEPVKNLADYDRRRRAHRNEVRYLQSLNDDLTDEIVTKLNDSEVLGDLPFDTVIVPEGGALLRTLAPLLPFYEVDTEKVKVLGTGLWNDKTLTNEPPLYGAWFAAPDPSLTDTFSKRFIDLFSEQPPRIATLSYDAVGLIASLIKEDIGSTNPKAKKSNYFTREALTDPSGFKGVDGLFRLLPDGTNERALAVVEIQRGKFEVVSAAPDAFPSFGYSLTRAALPK
ncbi:penicillin-binding protein activator [Kordiimonas sp. SCSIO 12610]|uniref:penicillin-binding protein activator n=1 Tax=Kordiimonas sp. SCSIO 12610 TaxID=2829597 RepID=UPI00210D1443|nr:penicillin-binding protein activator [Kordiimonas sp. SCSIO 12610]UTW55484.1 penicillin-binding protein activator [Kordiimonas sp. SCSIO 12610]